MEAKTSGNDLPSCMCTLYKNCLGTKKSMDISIHVEKGMFQLHNYTHYNSSGIFNCFTYLLLTSGWKM